MPLSLRGARGEVLARHYPSVGSTAGVVLVGGVSGGWDSPARGLYLRLGAELSSMGIGCLRVRFRASTRFHECVHDVLAGAAFLQEAGATGLGLVGHSLGGAVVIEAAYRCPAVRTVVALAPQSTGAESVSALGPRCSVLVAHGTRDTVIPVTAGERLYAAAAEPKELVVCHEAGHGLDEVADDLRRLLLSWLVEHAVRDPPEEQGDRASREW